MEEKDNREVEYTIPIAEFSALSKREQHALNMLYYSVMESLIFHNNFLSGNTAPKEEAQEEK